MPNARQLFPNWYKKAGFETDDTTLKYRTDAIDTILENQDFDFWIDLVKLILGVKISPTQTNHFVVYFSTDDAAFPLSDNQNLLRNLAAASVSILLDESDSELSGRLALTITNVVFLKQYDLSEFTYVQMFATYRLTINSTASRYIDLQEVESNIAAIVEENSDADNEKPIPVHGGELKSILNALNATTTTLKALKEEINVHWWLFGGYMPQIASTFEAIPVKQLSFLAAKELVDSTRFKFPLRNSIQFLGKAITEAKDAKSVNSLNLYDCISDLSANDKSLLADDWNDKIDFKTPILLAIKCSSETGGDDWSTHFKAVSNQANIKVERPPSEIADQLYRELIQLAF